VWEKEPFNLCITPAVTLTKVLKKGPNYSKEKGV